ncbi:TlpA family protein disulfide reductase [Streptomyces albidoflavus]|uniref:TlpA family protein disulfide reductase n=1 Tax=Streptomyces TaxID=1883 RepID=UPI0004C29610|nr:MULTISPECIES: TlpA disulfide reductase family protein [Streptomyces]MCO6696090.1 TlpA family protein disulfide reductase [Streptomyces sp. Vc17.3-30]QHC16189.1 redoxin domain-containing protein [Streptomyces sp. GF20]RZD61038.1 TlpA family protein disulfide reductase [Streptomyces albidoflavus]RZE42007.1 TlpA family protein disulfide reductase [Streptomyces albidoflavus]UNR58372.1 TlpA family protein disulfide reductase [Streptomyces sp. A10(2020)]
MSAASRAPRSRRVLTRRLSLTASAAVAALLLTACGEGNGGTTQSGSGANYVAGKDGIATVDKGERKDAPAIGGETLDGATFDLADHKGKVVVVNVWGSWCAPCRAEAPNLVKVAKDTADQGVQFVGINTRDSNKGPALAFEKDYEVGYPSLYDPQGKQILRFPRGSLSPQAIPSTVVIDRDGKIAARTLQAVSEKQLRAMIDPVLAEK